MDDIKQIREHLNRVKAYYMRNETSRALASAVMGVKGLVAQNIQPSMEMRGCIRDAVQHLSRDEQLKKLDRPPLAYQPGQERQLLAALAALYKDLLDEESREDHSVALARKQKLDQAYNLGTRLLAQGQISEADAAFTEASTAYKDEHRLFLLIGKALIDAGEVRRAIPYLKRGIEVAPEDTEIIHLLDEAIRLKGV